jgi:hypothetical protein
MARWKIWLALALIFLSGLALGVVGTGLYVRHQVKETLTEALEGNSQALSGKVMRNLRRALDLRTEQQKAMEPIVAKAIEDVRQARVQLRPRFMAIYQEAVADMQPHLTAEQRARLAGILAKVEKGLHGKPAEASEPSDRTLSNDGR